MAATTSAVPFLLIAAVAVLGITMFALRGLFRALQASEAVAVSGSADDVSELRCGFRLRSPGLLRVSYPMGRLLVSEDRIVVRGPMGDYSFGRDDSTMAVMSRRVLFHRVRLSRGDVVLTVFVRELRELNDALVDRGWSGVTA
jgi:hypothetical protein